MVCLRSLCIFNVSINLIKCYNDRMCYRWSHVLQMTTCATDDRVCYRWSHVLQMIACATDDCMCYRWSHVLQMIACATDDCMCYRWSHVLQMIACATDECACSDVWCWKYGLFLYDIMLVFYIYSVCLIVLFNCVCYMSKCNSCLVVECYGVVLWIFSCKNLPCYCREWPSSVFATFH